MNLYIKVSVVTKKQIIESELIFNQKIIGDIYADIIDENNNKIIVTLTIKEMTNTLQKYNILPSKISINDDDSINFIYYTKFKNEAVNTLSVISPTIILTNQELQDRKIRDVSTVENKFNDSFIKSINQEQHLPALANHTNDVVKNSTVTL